MRHSPAARNMEIRDAQPFEQSELTALHRRSSYVWEEDRIHFDSHPEVFGVPSEAIAEGRVRVAVGQGGALVGFSVVVDARSGACVLDDLFVDPDFMRQGVGRSLVEDAAARAVSTGHQEMTVIAHPRNFPFYESVGFVPGKPSNTRFGPAAYMRRQLLSGPG
jgi:GNAT superfamily N-acetyltransferase